MEDQARNMIRSYLKESRRNYYLQLVNTGGYAFAFYECAEYLLKHDCSSISLADYSRIFDEEVSRFEGRPEIITR